MDIFLFHSCLELNYYCTLNGLWLCWDVFFLRFPFLGSCCRRISVLYFSELTFRVLSLITSKLFTDSNFFYTQYYVSFSPLVSLKTAVWSQLMSSLYDELFLLSLFRVIFSFCFLLSTLVLLTLNNFITFSKLELIFVNTLGTCFHFVYHGCLYNVLL